MSDLKWMSWVFKIGIIGNSFNVIKGVYYICIVNVVINGEVLEVCLLILGTYKDVYF